MTIKVLPYQDSSIGIVKTHPSGGRTVIILSPEQAGQLRIDRAHYCIESNSYCPCVDNVIE